MLPAPSYRDILDRWSAIGKVPRDAVRPLESRLRAVDNAIKAAEDERWKRSNPEARARAEDTAAKLEAQIAALEVRAAQAEARGDHRAAREAAASAATYREWLAQAQRTASDLGGSDSRSQRAPSERCRMRDSLSLAAMFAAEPPSSPECRTKTDPSENQRCYSDSVSSDSTKIGGREHRRRGSAASRAMRANTGYCWMR